VVDGLLLVAAQATPPADTASIPATTHPSHPMCLPSFMTHLYDG